MALRRNSKSIGIRLSDQELALFEAQAQRMGLTCGALAKRVVLGFLYEEEHHETLDRFDRLDAEVIELRRKLAQGIEIVLLNVTPPEQKQLVQNWVKDHLGPPAPEVAQGVNPPSRADCNDRRFDERLFRNTSPTSPSTSGGR